MNFYSYYRLIFAILYPAYSSYKAIKNKDVREYARWMMYWVVFAIFSFIEVFTDIVIGLWLPFYYEIKILFILWLISSYGNGARIMYRNIVHPELNKREQIIDSYISSVKEYWVGLMWKIWQKGAIFFNKALLHFVNFAQMALFQHLQRTSHMDTSNVIEEPTVNLNPKSQRIRRRKAVENNLMID